MSNVSRGHGRERQVVKQLRDDGWVAFRAPASLGVADVVALRADNPPLFCEVKTDVRDPYGHFGPVKRRALSEAAERAGAKAVLVWWPAHRPARWIYESAWPGKSVENLAA